MTINEMIDALEHARDIVGGETVVKLASSGYHGGRFGHHRVSEVAIGVNSNEDDEQSIGVIKDAVWVVDGGQDRDRPYSVPELEDVYDVG